MKHAVGAEHVPADKAQATARDLQCTDWDFVMHFNPDGCASSNQRTSGIERSASYQAYAFLDVLRTPQDWKTWRWEQKASIAGVVSDRPTMRPCTSSPSSSLAVSSWSRIPLLGIGISPSVTMRMSACSDSALVSAAQQT